MREAGDPCGPLGAIGWQHDERQRDVMHAVNVADQALDHRVIEVIERSEEPALLGLRQQEAEQFAQRQQRADQRGRAVTHAQVGGHQLSTRSGRGGR